MELIICTSASAISFLETRKTTAVSSTNGVDALRVQRAYRITSGTFVDICNGIKQQKVLLQQGDKVNII